MFGSLRAWMFNRKASRARSRPDRILQTLMPRAGETVMDYGAGGGYFAMRIAEFVSPEGKVYAVDINPAFLRYIRKKAAKRGLRELEALTPEEATSRVPEASLDLIFMRNVTHHIGDRPALFSGFGRLLKPGGRVAIVEHLPGRGHRPEHSVPPETLVSEMESAGFALTNTHDFLPDQSFMIFIRRNRGA